MSTSTQSPLVRKAEELRRSQTAATTERGTGVSPVLPSLAEIDQALTAHFKTITAKMESFEDTILSDRLKIGLQALKAHVLFSIKDPGKRNAKGRNQATSTVDVASVIGFAGWLSESHTWLKKPTAYRWMTALKGLGLDENASEDDVETAVIQNQRIGPVSIKSLCAAALEAITPPAPEPPLIEQQEFDFLRQNLSAFRVESENLSHLKDKLDAYPDFKRAATARVYGLLYELTGTHWTPSDEADDLASVDPDAITL